MNIAFIEDTHLRGGTQIWVVEATNYFIMQGHNVNVIAPEGSYVAEECKKAGASTFTYDWDDIVISPEKYQAIWTEGLSKSDLDICTVHPPRGGFHCSIFAAKCIDDADLDTIHIPKTGSIVPWYKREYYIPNENINHKVISITEYTKDYLVSEYKIPKEKIELIYQGTEINRFTSNEQSVEEAKKRYELPDTAFPILASVGAYEDRKGQIVLLQAIKKLIDSNRLPNVHVLFVGEGPDEEMLRAVTNVYGLNNNVSFYPFTKEPNYVFDRIDILTLPSLYKEGLPNVILEAMSMKVPVVSSRMAGVPEVVIDGETGFMTDIGNVEQFADAIFELSKDKELMLKMGDNARELMEEKFDKKVQFAQFLDYFKSLVNS